MIVLAIYSRRLWVCTSIKSC